MKIKSTSNKSLIVIIVSLLTLFSLSSANNYPCNTTGLSGCTSCTDTTNKILFNNATQLYTCSDTPNCLVVSGNDAASQCLTCQSNYFVFNLTCYLKNIPGCVNYTVDANNVTGCSACVQSFMNPITNCSVDPNYCQTYDFTANKCSSCPVNKSLDDSGQYCIATIPNCIKYSYNGCLQCAQQYIIDTTNQNTCKFASQVSYQISANEVICLQKNFFYDPVQSKCVTNAPITINYCQQVDPNNSTSCTKCILGYFLINNTCRVCSQQIGNCITCTSCTNSSCNGTATCTNCLPTHFLFTDPQTSAQICRQCSIYGCKKCQLLTNSTLNNSFVGCLECQMGQTLFNNSCFSCPAGSQLNKTTMQCQPCPSNCQYCQNSVCTWCNTGYVFDPSQLKCKLSTSFTATLRPQTVTEILSKQFPLQQQLIYNSTIQLMSSCQQSATKYSCICSPNFSNKTSLCYNITDLSNTLNLGLVFSPQIINVDIFLKNDQTVRLMAQLPAFDTLTMNVQSTFNATTYYFTEDKIASLLEVYTQMLRRQSNGQQAILQPSQLSAPNDLLSQLKTQSKNRLLLTTSQTLTQLFNLVSSSFSPTFSLTQTTVLYGNGYYMKFYPSGANVTDTDSSFITVTNRNINDSLFVFVYFDGLNTSKSLTGNIAVFSPLASYNLNVNIAQSQFPSEAFTYSVFKNNIQDPSTSVTPQSFTLSLPISTSTATTPVVYTVNYQPSPIADIDSLYSSERIEFIFYQPAFIYVLVFLLAYLFLIPCCSLVDFIDRSKKGNRRKRVRTEDLSISEEGQDMYGKNKNKGSDDQQSSQTTIQITVNYKDFFPIYNICNTPRPRRILKLCLFLLNTQHSITFLTLIYFTLDPGHPVVAVVLGVPAYFCTVIMGYICGCFTLLKIPFWSKFFLNIIVIGYWIIWIALMPRFKSQQYQPYVYIFAIVFFIIDLLIDLLEMFMVYFTIKQSDRQMKMFQCLAAWLSKRGYYEYDKLARQINQR